VFCYRGDDLLDSILQKIKVIWKEVAQIYGENIMIETLGGDACVIGHDIVAGNIPC
jgi:hypothetical protein